MAQSKNRLGRGLGGLISGGGVARPEKTQEMASPETKVKVKAGGEEKLKATPSSLKGTKGNSLSPAQNTGLGYQEIALGKIKANPYQPRREIAEKQVKELAQSIQSEGLLQPIVVRSTGKGYELIAGERRLRAFKFLKSKTIPCRVIEASDASSASLALIENLQRENLNPIDEASGYASLVRDFDLTQEAAADRVGKGRATVANTLRLLSLSEEIKGFLSRRLLSTGHAKVLLGVRDEAQQHLLARRIIESNLSVREAEKIGKRLKEGLESSDGLGSDNDNPGKTSSSRAEYTAIADLEKRIEKHFNTNVSILHGKKKGKLVIEYFGNEDLDRLLELLGINQR